MYQFITESVTNVLFQLYLLTGNLGLAIITLTLLIRIVLIPLSKNALKSQQAIKELQPELKKLKDKHGKDKVALQQAQMELYKKYNINPLSGCIPYIVQIAFFIILYQVLIQFLGRTEMNGIAIEPTFLWLNLSLPDQLFIFPILAGISQFILSLMISPGAEQPDVVPNTKGVKKIEEENKKEEDFAEMAQTMQKQMLFFMPIMTVAIAWRFPSGLALYWVTTTMFSVVQQYMLSGWGGIFSYYALAKSKIQSFLS